PYARRACPELRRRGDIRRGGPRVRPPRAQIPRHPERLQGLAAASRPTGSAGGPRSCERRETLSPATLSAMNKRPSRPSRTNQGIKTPGFPLYGETWRLDVLASPAPRLPGSPTCHLAQVPLYPNNLVNLKS